MKFCPKKRMQHTQNSKIMDKAQQITEETGGDMLYADLFIASIYEGAAAKGGTVPQYIIDMIEQDVEKRREKRSR